MARILIAVRHDKTWQDVGRVLYVRDWDIARVVDRDDETGMPRQNAYQNTANGYTSLVHVIDDHLLGLARLVIEGDDAERVADELGEDAGAGLVRLDEIRTLVTSIDVDSTVLGLRYLAAMAPDQATPELMDLFRRGLEHPEPGVRDAAVQLAAYHGWPEVKLVAMDMATHDAHEGVRGVAAAVVASYERVDDDRPAPRCPEPPRGTRTRSRIRDR
jgi:hypothetical protein